MEINTTARDSWGYHEIQSDPCIIGLQKSKVKEPKASRDLQLLITFCNLQFSGKDYFAPF